MKADRVKNTGKPTLVCIHGWGYSYTFFTHFLKEAEKHFTVIRIDLPGYNGSKGFDRYVSVPVQAELLARRLHSLSLKKGDIIFAHSMGAMLTSVIAHEFPLQHIVLGGMSLEPYRPWYTCFLAGHAHLLTFLSKSRYVSMLFANQTQRRLTGKRGKRIYSGDATAATAFLQLAAIMDFDPLAYMPTPGNVVYVYGERDTYRQQAEKHNLPYTSIPQAGHNAMAANPTGFVSYIRSLLG